MARNLRLGPGEIDIVTRDANGVYVLVEVRGRTRERYRPSRTLSVAKRRRLAVLAEMLSRRYRGRVRIELVEIVGEPSGNVRFGCYRVDVA